MSKQAQGYDYAFYAVVIVEFCAMGNNKFEPGVWLVRRCRDGALATAKLEER